MTKILKCPSWVGSFPLNPFLKKLDELKSAEGKRRIMILTKFRISLYTILITYTMIRYIIQRIDNDLSKNLVFFKKSIHGRVLLRQNSERFYYTGGTTRPMYPPPRDPRCCRSSLPDAWWIHLITG